MTHEPEKKESILNIPASPPSDRKPGVMKGSKRQISLTIPPKLLEEIDVLAGEEGISRASWISQTLRRAIRAGAQ